MAPDTTDWILQRFVDQAKDEPAETSEETELADRVLVFAARIGKMHLGSDD